MGISVLNISYNVPVLFLCVCFGLPSLVDRREFLFYIVEKVVAQALSVVR